MKALLERIRGVLSNQVEAAPRELPGRNEPCWCGSGRKYKKCHLPVDDRKAAAKTCSVTCGST